MKFARLATGIVLALIGLNSSLRSEPGTPNVSKAADWSGLFIGAQGGGAWANTGWTFPIDSYFTLPNGRRSFDTEPAGGFAGGHITLNHQMGPVVLGAELAINGGAIDAVDIGRFTPLFPNDRFETRVDAFGKLVGRLGFAHDNFLLYATGGYARGHANFSALSAPPGGGVFGQVKKHLDGWTAGGGLEYLLTPVVVLGVEYEYTQLQGATRAVQTTGTPSNDPFVLHINTIELQAVSARISFKLDQPPPGPE
jgi:outer membrane immunogenic protein